MLLVEGLWQVRARGSDSHYPCLRMRGDDGRPSFISVHPVALHDWARFIKREAYFDDSCWSRPGDLKTALDGLVGGDGLLERVAYRWSKGTHPVTNVSWHEAYAFCAWQGGRLPWYEEWCRAAARGDAARPRTGGRSLFALQAGGQAAANLWTGGAGSEWCGEYWADGFYGADVRPVGFPLRRLAGAVDRMSPSLRGEDIGFRIAFDQNADAKRVSN